MSTSLYALFSVKDLVLAAFYLEILSLARARSERHCSFSAKGLVLDIVSENPFTSSVNAVVRNKDVHIQHIVLKFDNSGQRRDDPAYFLVPISTTVSPTGHDLYTQTIVALQLYVKKAQTHHIINRTQYTPTQRSNPKFINNDSQCPPLTSTTHRLHSPTPRFPMRFMLYSHSRRYLFQLRSAQYAPCHAAATPELDWQMRDSA